MAYRNLFFETVALEQVNKIEALGEGRGGALAEYTFSPQ